ncbi:hypothetical protein ANN_14161 [Periplaneta americana]|uniref:Uncharacterized protein n=1 Tax=Periplaneta americana TaxID=6978 RepID=A0ABQ8SVL0_PERAM|nr:hypothetical protein ANN_14161 [Periplaneta americana]
MAGLCEGGNEPSDSFLKSHLMNVEEMLLLLDNSYLMRRRRAKRRKYGVGYIRCLEKGVAWLVQALQPVNRPRHTAFAVDMLARIDAEKGQMHLAHLRVAT